MQVSPLAAWSNYYVIVGSAAAALTGLMFVVITLIASAQTRRSSGTIAAFGTPNVVHFGASLLIAALLNAPWQALWQVSILLGLCGLGGIIYGIIILQRTRHQTGYQPVLEDWAWHIIIPLISYTVLVVAAILLPLDPIQALFGVGAVAIMLLFVGIHNAWDTITYILLEFAPPEQRDLE